MSQLTAETITDEQIREYMATLPVAHDDWWHCRVALYGAAFAPPSPRSDARAHLAEILNANGGK